MTRGGLATVAMTLLLVATFGPYLAPGIRTEQLAVHAAGALAVTAGLPFLRVPRALAVAGMCWLLYLGVAVVGLIAPPFNLTGYPTGGGLAGVDNLLLPISASLAGIVLANMSPDPRRLLRTAARWTVLLMCFNTVAAVLQSQSLWDWSPWWSAEDGFTVAMNAAGNGRFSGLINQPVEAGLLYGLAMLAALYLWLERPRVLLPVLAVLGYGGAMTVSKVFLLVAAPLVAWQLLAVRRARALRLAAAVVVAVGAYVVVQAGWLPQWAGGDQIRQILPQQGGSLLTSITANRFGERSTLLPVVDAVLSCSPFAGMGAGGLVVPYDNGWVEALVLAGIIGAACYTVVLLVLARAAWRMTPSPERLLFRSAILLAVGASFGVPALTANRAGTVFWLLTSVILVAEARRSAGDGDAPGAGRGVDRRGGDVADAHLDRVGR